MAMTQAAESASVTPTKKKARATATRLKGRDRTVLILMIAVPASVHFLLVWIPTLSSILLSFTDWNGIRFSDMSFVRFRNYDQIFTVFELDFFQALINNIVLMVFLFLGPTLFGILLAYLLDKEIKGSRFYQSVFYTPVVLSLAVTGFIWQSVIYSPGQGLATELWRFLGFIEAGEEDDWLGDQEFLISFGDTYGISKNFIAILIAIAWTHAGYIMVLYLAGLKSVDPALREAASVDGANEWQTFRRVIFPVLKPINVIITVITVIQALRAFDIVFVLNVPRKTELLSVLTTNNLLGEGGGNVGRGSAYASLLFLLCVGFVIWYVTNHFRTTENQ